MRVVVGHGSRHFTAMRGPSAIHTRWLVHDPRARGLRWCMQCPCAPALHVVWGSRPLPARGSLPLIYMGIPPGRAVRDGADGVPPRATCAWHDRNRLAPVPCKILLPLINTHPQGMRLKMVQTVLAAALLMSIKEQVYQSTRQLLVVGAAAKAAAAAKAVAVAAAAAGTEEQQMAAAG